MIVDSGSSLSPTQKGKSFKSSLLKSEVFIYSDVPYNFDDEMDSDEEDDREFTSFVNGSSSLGS